MEEHEKALMLLVHQLQEYPGAEQYCMDNSEVSVHVSSYPGFQELHCMAG